jgi:hypothetical protein
MDGRVWQSAGPIVTCRRGRLALVAIAGGLLAACGQSNHAAQSVRATPSSTPDLQRSAASALNRAVTEENQPLNSASTALRAAASRGDVQDMQSGAIPVDRAIIAFDDTINAITFPETARADAQALVTANHYLEDILESINEATSRSVIESLYSQIPMAQAIQQTKLNQLATDLGLPPTLDLAAIAG